MAFGSESSFSRDCSTSTHPQSPRPNRPYPAQDASVDRAFFFSFVEGIGRSDPMLGSLPANPHPRQGSPDGLPANPFFAQALLATHLGGHRKRPQATVFAELSGALMKHLAQSLCSLIIEGSVDGVRAIRASLQRLGKTFLVEDVDGVAHRLRVTAKVAGDLVGVLSISAGEKYLATAQGEGIRRAQSRLQGVALGVTQRTHEDRSFHSVEDNH